METIPRWVRFVLGTLTVAAVALWIPDAVKAGHAVAIALLWLAAVGLAMFLVDP